MKNQASEQNALLELVTEVLKDRMPFLKPNGEYTVKMMFGDLWKSFDNPMRVTIGSLVKKLVNQGQLQLILVGQNSSYAFKYRIIL